jgi:MFS family permease
VLVPEGIWLAGGGWRTLLAMSRRQKLTLVLLLGTQFMVSVDFSVFNVAQPTIGRSVGISLADMSWIATAFALPTAGFTLLLGRVADLVGRRRILLIGLATLVAASVIGGVSSSPATLFGARVLQGLATAATIPAAFALLIASFPVGPLRARALGMNGALLSAGFTAGALLGGVFTTALSWRWAFLFNIPFALLIMLAVPRVIAESRGGGPRRVDAPGAATVTLGLLALVYGVVSAGEARWTSTSAWLLIAFGVVLLSGFLAVERRSAHPLVSPAVLRRPTVAWGNLGGFTVLAMESALLFVLTIYLQRVLVFSALEAGLLLGTPGVASVITGLLAPRTIARFDAPVVLVGGMAIQGAAGLALLAVTGPTAKLPLLLALVVIGFVGHVHGLVAFTVTATSGVPAGEVGLATNILTMTQQAAVTLGTPIIGTIATAAAFSDLTRHIHLAIAIQAAATLVAAAAVGIALLRPRTAVARPHPIEEPHA